jgi:hypothetical protein
MREIEDACKMKFTCIINNSNLGKETTTETIAASAGFIEKLCTLSGLPLWLTTAEESTAMTMENVFPLRLQKKIFDLPPQMPGNRPLWG